jgi:hypothetical protein
MLINYIDPGTGSALIAAVMGGLSGLAVFVRHQITRIKAKKKK